MLGIVATNPSFVLTEVGIVATNPSCVLTTDAIVATNPGVVATMAGFVATNPRFVRAMLRIVPTILGFVRTILALEPDASPRCAKATLICANAAPTLRGARAVLRNDAESWPLRVGDSGRSKAAYAQRADR
jgi:hypothetical protein